MDREEFVLWSEDRQAYVSQSFSWTSFLDKAMTLRTVDPEVLTSTSLIAVPVTVRRVVELVNDKRQITERTITLVTSDTTEAPHCDRCPSTTAGRKKCYRCGGER